ncbi:MAG: SusC/RagA family TonB-linked outer membrane protein [Dysgonamonadaceae bacterium]|jgi:TonB-linked SusC/RagA family outer membrane protein|nr:SusC/RagA family TonB-linked outer membrane protein [Dysgonamonadaceae bacterium]
MELNVPGKRAGTAEKKKGSPMWLTLNGTSIRKTFVLLFILTGCFAVETAFSQEIKGVVVDEKGEALIGASVKVIEKNGKASSGTVTNFEGQYSVKAPNSNASLEFSYIGYATRSIPASDKQSLSRVVMKEDLTELSEVVVTGMTKIDKRLFTGASDRLISDDVRLTGVSELGRSLEGRAAGVSVQNVSGVFGSGPRVKVRGATSILGDSKPLWVVDGVIIEDVKEVSGVDLTSGDASTLISSAIAGLSAADIESFDILKDGAATSIYGARAMAGVFVVTTKKGKQGTSRISYTGEFTSRPVPSYNEFNIMNSQDQMDIYRELEQKGWLKFTNRFRTKDSGIYGKMYQMINTYNPASGQFLMENTEAARNAYLREAEMRNTDWFSELFSPAIQQSHSISISGGSDKTTYYGSLSALIDPGWMMQSQVKRYTMNTNITHNIFKNLSVNIAPRAWYVNQNAPGTYAQVTNSVYSEVSREFELNPYSYALNTARTLDPNEFYTRNWAPFNIKDELQKNYIEKNELNFNFQGELKWTPVRGLDLKVLGAIKFDMTSLEHNILDDSNQAQAYRAMYDQYVIRNNSYLYTDPEIEEYSDPISILPVGGIYRRTDYKLLGYDFRPSFDFTKGFLEDHIVSVFGGMEINVTNRQETKFTGWGRQYSMGDQPFFVYEAFKKWQQNNTDYFEVAMTRKRNVAFFCTGSYSYKGKYIVNGTWRYEGSNRMGKAQSARWMPTWNVSGAWNLHDETFFAPAKPTISNAKLRASYSLTADAPPSWLTNSRIVIGSRNPWRYHTSMQESELYLSDPENSELTYEKKHELDLGIDIGFFNNRISLIFDWWKRNMFDLIGTTVTATYGTQYANLADMKSHGIEFTLNTKNIVSKDFNWSTNATFSKSHIEITNLESNARILDFITGEGYPRVGYENRALFSIPFAGLDEKGIPQVITEKGTVGRYVYFQDRVNTDFLIYEGPSEPTMVGGFGNTLSYKNLRMNVFLTYSLGNKLRLPTVFSRSYTDLIALPKEFKNRWIMPGDENYTNIPVIPTERQAEKEIDIRYAYSAYNYSDVRVADGGFVRLKDVSLTYDFPKKWISAVKITNLSLKLQATNLLLLYADKKLNGADPEYFRSGGVSYPVSRQYTLTLQLGL